MSGIAEINSKRQNQEQKELEGKKLRENLIAQAKKQISSFESSLKKFAIDNGKKIKEDPEFRAAFNNMCLAMGVDPLQSRKGFWSSILKVGDFYHELAIKTIEVTLRHRHEYGGMVLLDKIIYEVSRTYAVPTKISPEDIKTAIKGLDSLGKGYSISTINKKLYLLMDSTVDSDRQKVLECANDEGYFTDKDLAKLSFDNDRLNKAVDTLYKEGFIWRDELATDKVVRYYVFSMFKGFA